MQFAIRSLLSCKVKDRNFLSCNFQDLSLLSRLTHSQQVDYICKKDLITDVWLDSKCTPDCRCCKCRVQEVEVHEICNRSLVHWEVAEARSDYRKSYFWSCRNIACGDSTWSNQIGKDRVRLLAD